MKEKVIQIINSKIEEIRKKRDQAKKDFDLVRTGNYQRIIDTLSELIQEIQDTL